MEPSAPSAPPAASASSVSADDRQWGLFLHLSALSGFVIGLGFLLGPLILWVVRKDKSPFIDRHGKAAVNFQLNLLILVIAVVAVGVVAIIGTLGIGALVVVPLFIIGALALTVAEVLFPVRAALRANEGKEPDYPVLVTFLK